jgi:predicted nucleotidyltransferase
MAYAQHQPSPRNIDEIKQLISKVVNPHRHKEILWIGLSGSFARNQQTPNSDVDLIIGYTVFGHSNQVWDVQQLTREFEMLGKRAFDLVYVRDREVPRRDKPIGAFLNSLTVFERDPRDKWLDRNRRLVSIQRYQDLGRKGTSRSELDEIIAMFGPRKQVQKEQVEEKDTPK